MYIVIGLIVHGPDIEKAAGTIREIINQATCRIDDSDKVLYCFENARRCTMASEPGDHLYAGTPSLAMPFMKPSM
jgi:hypothetical protein